MNENRNKVLPPLPSTAEVSISAGHHGYPHRLAQYVREMVLAQFTYQVVKRAALQTLVRHPDGLEKLRMELNVDGDGGLREDVFRDHWQIERRFVKMRPIWDNQDIILHWSSAWDWFIRRVAQFISKAQLAKGIAVSHKKVLNMPFRQQISWLDRSCQSHITDERSLGAVEEMIRVRHLGVHNAWQVDQKYLGEHPASSFRLGQIRVVEDRELSIWQAAMLEVIDRCASVVAERFSDAPSHAEVEEG